MKKSKIILIIIIFVGLFLRTWNVSSNPPSLYWDEVSQGYNAFAIATTGFDEHREFFPIARFRAFGDNKAPVSIYLTAIAISIFGKTTFAIRSASVILGSLTILFAYLLTKELFYTIKKREYLAIIVAMLLAISPWHIFLSRAGYEANIATFFTVVGVYLFFYAKRVNAWFYTLSILSFVIGFYAFNAHRIFIPLLVLSLVMLFYRDLFAKKKPVIIAAIIGIILLIPMIKYFTTQDSKIRFNEVNIFSDPEVVMQSNSWLAQDKNSFIGKIFDNRRVGYALLYAKHYFDFFNPQYIFFTGDVNPRFSSQSSGELWLWELPFILFGFYCLFKFKNKTTIFIFLWFILAPIAAATARETPHALRSETYIPIYEIIAGLGIFSIVELFKIHKKLLFISGSLVIVFAIFQAVYVVHAYATFYPVKNSYDWQYGYQQAIEKAEELQDKYDLVAFTDTYGRAYIYYLYYANVPVEKYWREGNPKADVFGLYNVTKVGKYEFRTVMKQSTDQGKRVLYVVSPSQLTPDLHETDRINFLNGTPAFIFAVKNE